MLGSDLKSGLIDIRNMILLLRDCYRTGLKLVFDADDNHLGRPAYLGHLTPMGFWPVLFDICQQSYL